MHDPATGWQSNPAGGNLAGVERRDWYNRPPDSLFNGSTGLPPEKEKEIWRHAVRILLAARPGCGVRIGREREGVAIYGVYEE